MLRRQILLELQKVGYSSLPSSLQFGAVPHWLVSAHFIVNLHVHSYKATYIEMCGHFL